MFILLQVAEVFNVCVCVCAQWRVVNELEKLRSLLHLSCRRNPLLQREKNLETARQIMIARLSRLQLLDRRQVTFTRSCLTFTTSTVAADLDCQHCED